VLQNKSGFKGCGKNALEAGLCQGIDLSRAVQRFIFNKALAAAAVVLFCTAFFRSLLRHEPGSIPFLEKPIFRQRPRRGGKREARI
jgi:hypothetical protein